MEAQRGLSKVFELRRFQYQRASLHTNLVGTGPLLISTHAPQRADYGPQNLFRINIQVQAEEEVGKRASMPGLPCLLVEKLL